MMSILGIEQRPDSGVDYQATEQATTNEFMGQLSSEQQRHPLVQDVLALGGQMDATLERAISTDGLGGRLLSETADGRGMMAEVSAGSLDGLYAQRRKLAAAMKDLDNQITLIEAGAQGQLTASDTLRGNIVDYRRRLTAPFIEGLRGDMGRLDSIKQAVVSTLAQQAELDKRQADLTGIFKSTADLVPAAQQAKDEATAERVKQDAAQKLVDDIAQQKQRAYINGLEARIKAGDEAAWQDMQHETDRNGGNPSVVMVPPIAELVAARSAEDEADRQLDRLHSELSNLQMQLLSTAEEAPRLRLQLQELGENLQALGAKFNQKVPVLAETLEPVVGELRRRAGNLLALSQVLAAETSAVAAGIPTIAIRQAQILPPPTHPDDPVKLAEMVAIVYGLDQEPAAVSENAVPDPAAGERRLKLVTGTKIYRTGESDPDAEEAKEAKEIVYTKPDTDPSALPPPRATVEFRGSGQSPGVGKVVMLSIKPDRTS